MRVLSTLVLLFFVVAGCNSHSPPLPPPPDDAYEASLPNLDTFRATIRLIDRVEVYFAIPGDGQLKEEAELKEHRTVRKKISMTSRESIEALKKLLQEPSVKPSFTPAMLWQGPPEIVAYQGNTRLFLLKWKHETKFQLFYPQEESVAGSYQVPEQWLGRYLAICEPLLEAP